VCPVFSDGASLSTTCGEKVCRLQKHHEMCKWPISDGEKGEQTTSNKGNRDEDGTENREEGVKRKEGVVT